MQSVSTYDSKRRHDVHDKETQRRFVVGLVAIALLAVPAHADEVTDWNQTMLRAALVGSTCPPVTSRVAAIVQAASSTP